MDMIIDVEKPFMKKRVTKVSVGDLVEVSITIVEEDREGGKGKDKERLQKFTGIVIAKKGNGIRANFTVRRIVEGEGVERTFPIHAPNIKKIRVIKSHKVRLAKLYYLREKMGKETRLKERFKGKTTRSETKSKPTEEFQEIQGSEG